MGLIKLRNVSFKYGAQKVLYRVNLDIEKSDFVLLEGASGIGKSTLCQLLAGYLRPDEGDLMINGMALQKPGRQILYIPQEDDLFEWHTLRQHFDFLGRLSNVNEPNEALLQTLGIQSLLDKFPKELSGGQKKKAQIYKAYLVNPEIIIFDETFSAIDQNSTDKILSVFSRIWKEKKHTVVFISHYSQNIKPFVNKILRIENQSVITLDL